MKSKLLQKKIPSLDQQDKRLDGQPKKTEDLSEPVEATRGGTTQSIWLLMPKPLRKHTSQSGA
jgi:hypothetical protein